MTNSYSCSQWVLRTGLMLAPLGAVLAQAPVITAVTPMANATAVARTSPVIVNFNQPLPPTAAGALKVFSAQRGGQRARGATPAVVSGNTLSFMPTAYDFMPGETVQYTVSKSITSAGGTLERAQVGQFTTAVGGTGTGNFQAGINIPTSDYPNSAQNIVLGDANGDGSLDLFTLYFNVINSSNTVGVRFGNGNGLFGSEHLTNVANGANTITLGDVDDDGDLDLLTANSPRESGVVSVRFNDGNGNYAGSQDVKVATAALRVALSDVDGDGDLDLLTINNSRPGVSMRLNNGSGVFSGGQDITLNSPGPTDLALGDIDNDGDLDLLTADFSSTTTVSIRQNDGNGNFSGNTYASVPSGPFYINLGDVNGDGALDLVCRASAGTSVRINDGRGTFSGGQDVNVRPYAGDIKLGDIDGDGDLDIIVCNGLDYTATTGTVNIHLNDGNGIFGAAKQIYTGNGCRQIILGDIDGDNDLDILFSTYGTDRITRVLLNSNTVLAATTGGLATTFSLSPNPAHRAVTVTGTAPKALLSLLDALGRVVFTTTSDATGTTRLDLPIGLSAGVYVVRSGEQVQRLVIE